MSQRLFLPRKGFTSFVLYREPLESDVRVIFPEYDYAIYKTDLDEVRRWLLLQYNSTHFVDLALDELWNFYHIKMVLGVDKAVILPLVAAKAYFAKHDDLEGVMDLVNRRPLG